MTRLTHAKAVAQCVGETALAWLRREQLLQEPHRRLADFEADDDLLQARLQELVAAGDTGWRACERELAWEEPGEVFPAAFVALETADSPARLRCVLRYALRSYELSRPLIAALAWRPLEAVLDLLEDFLTAQAPPLQRIGLAAAIAHRRVPESALATAIAQLDPSLRGRALRGVGELGFTALLPQAAEHVAGGPDACAFEAAWTCALRGRLPAALSLLSQATQQPGTAAQRAIGVVARTAPVAEAAALVGTLAQHPPHLRTAIIGAAALGDPALIEWLLTLLDHAETARAAGEAITMITGIPLDDPQYQASADRRPTADDPSGEPMDGLDLGPDDYLPWPSRCAVIDWWGQHRSTFSPGCRYLLGRPITVDWCRRVLAIGRQRQRMAAALELAVLCPDQPLFETRAPGWRQRAWVDSLG